VEYGTVEVVCVMLEHDPNVDAEDENGRTPLHEAAAHGMVEIMRVLLEHDPNIDAEDKNGRTPLHEAATYLVVGVYLLLEHRAIVGVGEESGRTPLHELTEYREAEAMLVLLEHGANVGAEDKKGETPFQIASLEGYRKIMKRLSGMFSISTSSMFGTSPPLFAKITYCR
jgi:ankyrin repeat protein